MAGDVNWRVREDCRVRLKLREAMIDAWKYYDCDELSTVGYELLLVAN